jgi:small subunit ribosomal protein S5
MEQEVLQEGVVTETVSPVMVADGNLSNEGVVDVVEGTVSPVVAAPSRQSSVRGRSGGRSGGRARPPRERGEFDQVTIDARRVARVMAGGRRFNFSLVVVIGDRKGRVGVGLGKGFDTALAIDKATRDAKKHLFSIPRTSSGSIPHEVSTKYASSTVEIIPSRGRGLVAGSAMRTVLDLAGVTDVVTKIHSRSKNKLTIARATVEALKKLRSK